MKNLKKLCVKLVLLLLPLVLQPAVGFGLSNNTSPFVPIYHQLSPSSHYQHLKTSFHFSSPSFPGSSSSSRPFQFLSEDLFRHPILLHSLQTSSWLLTRNIPVVKRRMTVLDDTTEDTARSTMAEAQVVAGL